jgi:PST family polysaccharide transporter
MSRQMVQLFTQQVASVIAPIMAGMRSDAPRALAAFLRASRLLAFIGVPVTLGIAAVVWVGMPLVLSPEKWGDLPPVLAVMCLGISMRVLTESSVALVFAVGRFREQQRFSVVSSVLFCVCVLVGAWLGGPLGAAVGFAVFCTFAGPAQVHLSIASLGGTWSQAMATIFVPVGAALASILPWVVIAGRVRAHDAVLVAGVIVLSGLSYLMLARLRRATELRELVERVGEQAPARFRPTVRRLGALVAGVRPA